MNKIAQILDFLKETPNDNFLIHALALEYSKAGDDAMALHYFETNLAQTPGYVATYYHLGKLLEKTGKTEEAITIYLKGMEQAKLAGDQHAYSELRSVHEDLTF